MNSNGCTVIFQGPDNFIANKLTNGQTEMYDETFVCLLSLFSLVEQKTVIVVKLKLYGFFGSQVYPGQVFHGRFPLGFFALTLEKLFSNP